ncbi:hypothetical protein [Streptomyces sp. NPDC059788]|uniref:hypothetical protein n=1 Tax=Streptomyces sp. NPDC059788 TaxID=3346948 RepID=UPI0036567720
MLKDQMLPRGTLNASPHVANYFLGRVVGGPGEMRVERRHYIVLSITHLRRPNRSLDSMPLRAMRTPMCLSQIHRRR